jgi:anti-sigma regulatory factor (Ser/Thr protein kinase)
MGTSRDGEQVERILVLSGGPGDIGRARRWAAAQVREPAWPLSWRPDAAEVALLVSELVTNALQHAGGIARLSLTAGARRLRVVVSDDSLAWPVMRPPAPGVPGGRGLRIVDAIAAAWGAIPHHGGKQVWAELVAPGTGDQVSP